MYSPIINVIKALFLLGLGAMLWTYSKGYDLSIDWEVTTTGKFVPYEAWSMDNGLMKHTISSDKLLLLESYQGTEIKENTRAYRVFPAVSWVSLCIVLAGASFLKRVFFFITIAAFALFINRLNLFEIGLFGIQNRMVLLIPFLFIAGPLIYFNEYRKNIPYTVRLAVLLGLSAILFFGIEDLTTFGYHYAAHTLFSFTICGVLFLLIIVEEPIFALLWVITRTKGSGDNHIHFTVLALMYLGNLTLYYLNRSGYVPNSFFFFDSFILVSVTSVIAFFTLKYKVEYLSSYSPGKAFFSIFFGLGLLLLSVIGFSMFIGMDAVYQGFYYFILYAHLGIGVFFFLYLIINFIDPLIKGLPVYKIAYHSQHFPYVSARLAGLITALGFFFLSGQEGYQLIRSAYYTYLGNKENYLENELLGYEYYENAAFIGIKTHYPNYKLGFRNLKTGNKNAAKLFFSNAATRFGSDYAYVNYGNIDKELNSSKVQAQYEETLRKNNSNELKNNLGILYLEKGNLAQAFNIFQQAKSDDEWNKAPIINKWYVLNMNSSFGRSELQKDLSIANFGLKANMLASDFAEDQVFDFQNLANAPLLHRRSYLLNSLAVFTDTDSLASFASREIIESSNGDFNQLMRKSLAIYRYNSGEVNKAFKLLNELQANASNYDKGEFLDMLGKFALEQGAHRLGLKYFEEAIDYGSTTSRFSKIEALACLGNKEDLITTATKIIEIDPGLTNQVNDVLSNLETFECPAISHETITASDLDLLISHAKKNAFRVDLIARVVATAGEEYEDEKYNLLLEAIQINPYSDQLLKQYIFMALDWNLINYAEEAKEKLKGIVSDDDYQQFDTQYKRRVEEIALRSW